MPDNQVLIGGRRSARSKASSLTDDNLAEVDVDVEQELHEGTTAVDPRHLALRRRQPLRLDQPRARTATRRSTTAPTLGLASTTTPVDIDQFFNTFPPPVRKRPRRLHQGQRGDLRRPAARTANEAYKYFGTGAQPGRRLRRRTERRPAPASSASSSAPASSTTAVAERGEQLSSAISNANTAFDAIASQNVAFDQTLRRLPPVFRQANTTFVNLRAALDDLDPLVETAKPATKDLAPFLAELRPVSPEAGPVHQQPAPHRAPARARPTTPPNCSATLPTVQQRASKAFPHAEEAIAAFQPNLNFVRAYTPDLFNGFGKLGQVDRLLRRQRPLRRASLRRPQNLFNYDGGGELEPITPSEQYDAFGSSADGQAPLPRRRHPARPRRLQPVRRTAVHAAPASPPPNATRPTRPRDHEPRRLA